jgi:hypothetical protein
MSSLEQEVEAIAERIFERKISEWKSLQQNTDVRGEILELRNKLVCINAKDHISIAEAALLLNCSDGHVRNLIGKARKRQTNRPIPFCDLDGVTVFNRLALLEWISAPTHKLEAICAKDETSNG